MHKLDAGLRKPDRRVLGIRRLKVQLIVLRSQPLLGVWYALVDHLKRVVDLPQGKAAF
jgi:hypothetical protein